MKILLLSVLAVTVIGVMLPSAYAEEKVPSWVKNTVSWWAEDEIGEDEFLNSIQYLIESKIIVLASEFQSRMNDSKAINIELPNRYDPPLIHRFSDKSSGILLGQAKIVVTSPDQTTEKFFSAIKNGKFSLTYQITSEHQLGTYYIKAFSGDEKIWESKFSIHEKSSERIPNWIKNNGKWWNEGKIHDSAFLDGIKYLIETEIIVIENKDNTQQGSKDKCESRMLADGTESPSYLWSDGKCYNTPESELFSQDYEINTETVCSSDYPYLWSDGTCWNVPEEYRLECSLDYQYLWSDGKCYNAPECSDSYPYRHSNGMCYDGPEEYRLECPATHPYEYSDGKCGSVPEHCPSGSYRHGDGMCYNVPDCSQEPGYPYLWSDGTCRPDPEHCTGDYPYRWDDGQCYNIPQSCYNPTPWRHSDGMCYAHPERTGCPAGYHQETDYDFCCPDGYYAGWDPYPNGVCIRYR
ncbi:MAG TPA: hypothetical protein OQH54_08160 [Nitrosopumilus sp.]|nr:hypothetical protein [Nitrosopumilus sp.]